ncbi:diguanylate cyclase [Dehalobacter sp. DCM]|uniref:HD domain-containing phosphohydrolase n=1 Tax=Dehalobacter sp. DCM TaxID=2907827 RepID=UPI003081D705|nr:diguanylate cyclase [Dehalobacter sp. DCM]
MGNSLYQEVLRNMPIGYSLYKVITDLDDRPCDYKFIEMNRAFEEATGLLESKTIGKKVKDVLQWLNEEIDWVKAYIDITCKGMNLEFERYCLDQDKWYRVSAFSPEKNYLVTLVADITIEKRKYLDLAGSNKNGIGAYIRDISKHKKQEQYLRKQLERQNILIDIYMRTFNTMQEQFNFALHEALKLTESEFGYIFSYDENSGEFALYSWENSMITDQNVIKGQAQSHVKESGVWDKVVQKRKPIIVNDFQKIDNRNNWLPKGHTMVANFMSIPIIIDSHIVAVIGMGNKENGYDEFDIKEITILMHSVWLAVEKRTAQERVLIEREKYNSILNELPAMVCEFLPDSTLTFANKAYYDYFGGEYDTLINKKILDIIPKEKSNKVKLKYMDLTPQENTIKYISTIKFNGKIRSYEWQDVGIFNKQGIPICYYSIGLDITERVKAEEEQNRVLKQLVAMFNSHEAVMLLIEPFSGNIVDANPAATTFYGYTKKELLKMCINEINTLPKEELANLRLKVLNKGQKYFTFPHRLRNGEIRIVDVYSSPISYNGKKLLFSIIFDVSQREEAYKEIAYLNYHDNLTDLYNRRFFEEEFKRLNVKRRFPIAVVMGDVNGLKLINDSFGYCIGDNLLKEAAKIIKGAVRADDIVARIGGDEFGIILPNVDELETRALIKRIEEQINKKDEESMTGKPYLSISFGYAVQERPEDSYDKLVKDAERFMYSRKHYDSRSLKSNTINIIMNTLFEKSQREKIHSDRVGDISASIARALGLDEGTVNKIKAAGCLHDIGKIGIPEDILNKQGILDEKEWEIMKSHSERSWRILENTYEFSEISNIVLHHHERWDGDGYPKGIKGEEIPLEARIITVADSYDAMTKERSYGKNISKDEAIEELKRCSQKHFDQRIVDVFINHVLQDYD